MADNYEHMSDDMVDSENPTGDEVQVVVEKVVHERFKHIDDLLLELQQKLIRRWLIAIVGLIVAGGGLYLVATKANDTAHLVAVERRTAIVSNCLAQDMRHDNTIKRLQASSRQEQTPAGARILQNELTAIGIHVTVTQATRFETISASQNKETIALINALAPHQNCQALVAKQASSQ